jgi:actin-related protein
MPGKRLWTVDQIKKYLMKQDSMGDMVYNLSDENIEAANEIKYECLNNTQDFEYLKGDKINEEAYLELDENSKQRFVQI